MLVCGTCVKGIQCQVMNSCGQRKRCMTSPQSTQKTFSQDLQEPILTERTETGLKSAQCDAPACWWCRACCCVQASRLGQAPYAFVPSVTCLPGLALQRHDSQRHKCLVAAPFSTQLVVPERRKACARCATPAQAQNAATTTDDQRPLAVIIGFLGSSDRILCKYVEVYEELGMDVVAMTPSFSSMFLGHLGARGRGSRQVRKWCGRLQVSSRQSSVVSVVDKQRAPRRHTLLCNALSTNLLIASVGAGLPRAERSVARPQDRAARHVE